MYMSCHVHIHVGISQALSIHVHVHAYSTYSESVLAIQEKASTNLFILCGKEVKSTYMYHTIKGTG